MVAGASSLPFQSTQTPSSGDGGATCQPKPSTSSFSQPLPGFKSAQSLLGDDGLTNSQKVNKETAVHEEVILRDMVDACFDDREGNYFDEYGGGVSVQPGIDLTNAVVEEANSDEIMALAEFMGEDDDNTLFVPSQEPSDDEGPVTPPVIYGVADDSDQEITEIPVKFRPSPRKRKGRYKKTLPDYPKLARLPIEEVKSLPWDVDGDRHFKIKNCSENTWNDRQKDGRWYLMTTSSRKGLNGVRKVGTCQGSRICQNVQCPKLQSEGICNVNPKEFSPDHGAYICKCCGYYAVQIFCGCRKYTEFDKVTKHLDVWYEGKHNCVPKPDKLNKRNFFELLPLSRDLRSTPHEFRNDCVRYFVSIGEVEKAKEVALLLDNGDELEKMRYLLPDGKRTHYCPNLTVAFEVVKKIKNNLTKSTNI